MQQLFGHAHLTSLTLADSVRDRLVSERGQGTVE
jgi:hypothetical protein